MAIVPAERITSHVARVSNRGPGHSSDMGNERYAASCTLRRFSIFDPRHPRLHAGLGGSKQQFCDVCSGEDVQIRTMIRQVVCGATTHAASVRSWEPANTKWAPGRDVLHVGEIRVFLCSWAGKYVSTDI